MIIRFRLFDDGLGFRYEFLEQNELNYFTVSNEKTEFNLTGDHKAFWIPADYDTNEYAYFTTRLSDVDATKGAAAQEIAVKRIAAANAVQTPLMMKTSDGLYVNIHEAALVNYPAMNLTVATQTFGLTSHLVPDAVGNRAYMQAPDKTPGGGAVFTVGFEGGPVGIKPHKYVGIWRAAAARRSASNQPQPSR